MSFATYFRKNTWYKDNGTVNNMESLTDQSLRYRAEINDIMLSMQVPTLTPPRFDMDNYDIANWTFEDWQNEKAKIERKFLHLTPEMRAYFGNAQEFLKYCTNSDNYELTETGMIEKPKELEVIVPPVITPVVPEVGGGKSE